MKNIILLSLILNLVIGSAITPAAFAQFQQGGVDKPGTWWAGEGLKQGDFFSYSMCHVDYKECTEFEMDMWIKGDKQVGSEDKWLAEVVVWDGSKIVKGEMELGKLAPEPTGGSEDLGVYRGAFKSSIAWLSAFATGYEEGGKTPKAFTAKSWGKIGNIGGEQVIPTAIETITIPAGTFETVLVTWKTGGSTSKVWIVDDFPFPIKADTLTHVSEGIPPPEYTFQLLKYEENVQTDPFEDIIPTDLLLEQLGCETHYDKVALKKPTNNFDYQIHLFYGPENPVQGCPIEFLIKFISKYDDTEFLNQVQYDFWAVDADENFTIPPLRSLAQQDNKNFLYSPSGQATLDFIVEEEPGMAHYVIWIYGLSPEGIVPSNADDHLLLSIPISKRSGDPDPVPDPTAIPEWIKNNAGWWAEGAIGDSDFVQGIQFLIQEGIMKIPPTTPGTGSGGNEIPEWIKNNAGWWAEGAIGDSDFVQGLQYLIKEGIMKISS